MIRDLFSTYLQVENYEKKPQDLISSTCGAIKQELTGMIESGEKSKSSQDSDINSYKVNIAFNAEVRSMPSAFLSIGLKSGKEEKGEQNDK